MCIRWGNNRVCVSDSKAAGQIVSFSVLFELSDLKNLYALWEKKPGLLWVRYPYGKVKFQNQNFEILIADLHFSQKSMNWKCPLFLNILIRSTWKKASFCLNLPSFLDLIIFLTELSSKYQKKKNTFNSDFFERNPNLQSVFQNSDFEIWLSHRDSFPKAKGGISKGGILLGTL